ncbi:stage II sporulation protein P [Salsuginibacillus kocurii]|uniref:stage II sporulation protein P n=1 Tax=Salsuginibacillus kocurii TaxID=427078 RepID=UPI000365B84E|nr:stage II sporulation protein P [Salsuginibacillus kocurii]
MKQDKRSSKPVYVKHLRLRNVLGFLFIASCLIFLSIAALTSFEQNRHFSSTALHDWTNQLDVTMLLHAYQMENKHYESVADEAEAPALSLAFFEGLTSVSMSAPRTLLAQELPGFSKFEGRVAVAGEGTDMSNMSMESAPPLDILMDEREAAAPVEPEDEEPDDEADKLAAEEEETDVEEEGITEDVRAHIIHSHSRESFFPELEEDAEVAFHSERNITLVGERLGDELEARGIPTEVNTDDIEHKLNERGWDYPQSYEMSRELVEEAKETHQSLDFFFDIHRDSQPRDITTVTINNETFARIVFVIGENHEAYEQNLEMAKMMHDMIEETHPGLSRGVIVKGGQGSNGRYNQDLSPQSVLIEFGGVENDLQEAYRSAEVMADVIAKYEETEASMP